MDQKLSTFLTPVSYTHLLFELLVPPTEPEFRQQGLQQELATKLGNTIPP